MKVSSAGSPGRGRKEGVIAGQGAGAGGREGRRGRGGAGEGVDVVVMDRMLAQEGRGEREGRGEVRGEGRGWG